VGIGSIVLMAGGILLMYVDRNVALPDVGSVSWTFPDVLNNVTSMTAAIVGIVLVSRRPDNVISWLFLAITLTLAVSQFATSYGLHALVADPGSLPGGHFAAWFGHWVLSVSEVLVVFIFFLFPTGHLPSRRWRPAAWFAGAAYLLAVGMVLLGATLSWSDPYGQAHEADATAALLVLLTILVPALYAVVASFTCLVVRFRTSTGDERLQLKWFVAGAAAVVASLFVGAFSTSPASSILQALTGIFFFVSIGVAILKYRLYEIDVVIRKTVVYGLLAAFFTAVYVAIVVGVGTVIGSTHNAILTLLAAVVVAFAFNPVREWARRVANRIVYGNRASPYEVLSEFSERMAGSFAMEDALPQMATILAEGTGARGARVWLRIGNELRPAATWGDDDQGEPPLPLPNGELPEIHGTSKVVAVRDRDELLGALAVTKPPNEPLSAAEDKLVDDLAAQAGLVLRNVRLTEELRASLDDLRASRLRLVAAQDQERRRIERNIHDGAQQQLVALAVKLRLAQGLVGDPERERATLEQLQTEATDALENLRDLARGIYPPLLADQGLAAALSSQARKASFPVEVSADGVGRYPQDVEAAVYFCCLEAMQNAAKYADPHRAVIRLTGDDRHIEFTVEDDGVGFDVTSVPTGSGLSNMQDRISALGGRLTVNSEPGSGTIVSGSIPIA